MAQEEKRGGAGARGRTGNRRNEARIKNRIPCELVVQGESQRAFVLDLSSRGLFIQTAKVFDPGAQIGVRLQVPDIDEEVELRVEVERSRRVPSHLASVSAPGVGVRVMSAPPEYWDFLADVMSRGSDSKTPAREEPAEPKPQPTKTPTEPAATPPPPAPEKPKVERRYSVRVNQCGGPRSRSVVVNATSPEDAEAQALEDLGDDWKIIAVERA